MSVKSKRVQFSYKKALICVVSAALSTTIVVTAGSMRGLQALGRHNVDHTKVSIKRYLRSNAHVTSSDYTGNLEERASFTPSLSSLTIRLKMSLSPVIQKLQLWWWSLWRNSPKYVFDRLRLGSTKAKLFESPAFSKWFAFLQSKYPNSVAEEMFQVLADHYKTKDLMEVLVAGTHVEQTKPIAEKLLEIQFKKWMKDPTTSVNEVLKYLKIKETEDLFKNPAFYNWVALIKNIFKDEEITQQIVYLNLVDEYKSEEALATALAKGIAANNPLAIKLEAIRQTPNNLENIFKVLLKNGD